MKVILTAALLAITCLAGREACAQVTQVGVTGGKVQGLEANSVSSFKGIPFAAPPTGERRWRSPGPVQPWAGVKSASAFGPACMQNPALFIALGMTGQAISEDCLYLNVWTPARTARDKLPVMVWIYGGAFTSGATSIPTYDGANLAKRGVIVVSIAYRVGPFGFLASAELSRESGHGSGNFGLEDQIAALKWVRGNIAAFGGDPSRVTIFGESAGGFAASMLTQSPLAKGLFQRTISESGGNFAPAKLGSEGGESMQPLALAEKTGQVFLESAGAKTLAEARALSAQQVLKGKGQLWPNHDDYVLPDDPYALYKAGKQIDTPILIGTNSDEGHLFTPPNVAPQAFEADIRAGYGEYADKVLAAYPHVTSQEAYSAAKNIFRDTTFAWPTYTWARLQAQTGKGRVFAYLFDQHPPPGAGPFYDPDGATHASEVAYVFGNLSPDNSPADRALSDRMGAYWTNFAKTGDPNGAGLPAWTPFTTAGEQTLVLGPDFGLRPTPNKAGLLVLDAYYTWRREQVGKSIDGFHRSTSPRLEKRDAN
jgi:para-nitrobenzyl esterase